MTLASSLQTALAEPQRVRLLHKARLIHDAKHAITKAYDEGRTQAGKKRKVVAAAPAWLKDRVEAEEELPAAHITARCHREEDEVRAAVLDFVVGGKLVKESYHELMESMVQTWDDERSRG